MRNFSPCARNLWAVRATRSLPAVAPPHSRRIESLVDYVLVDVDARSVERWTRDGDGWTRASFEPGESLALASIGTELSVAECFADLG